MKIISLSLNFHRDNYTTTYCEAMSYYGTVSLETPTGKVEVPLSQQALRDILAAAAPHVVVTLHQASLTTVDALLGNLTSHILEHIPETF